jgi:hypothetical protein
MRHSDPISYSTEYRCDVVASFSKFLIHRILLSFFVIGPGSQRLFRPCVSEHKKLE